MSDAELSFAYLSALDRLNMRALRHNWLTECGRVNDNTPLIASLMGIVYRGAARVRSLEHSGYELHPSQWHQDSEAKLRQTPFTIYLPAARFASAAQHCPPQTHRAQPDSRYLCALA